MPEGGENKVHLNEDAAERKYTAYYDVYDWVEVPLLVGNCARYGVNAARVVCSSVPVLTNDSSDESHWVRNKEPDSEHCNLSTL